MGNIITTVTTTLSSSCHNFVTCYWQKAVYAGQSSLEKNGKQRVDGTSRAIPDGRTSINGRLERDSSPNQDEVGEIYDERSLT